MPSHVRAVAKNDELSLRQFVLEKNVSPVRLPKQDLRSLYETKIQILMLQMQNVFVPNVYFGIFYLEI